MELHTNNNQTLEDQTRQNSRSQEIRKLKLQKYNFRSHPYRRFNTFQKTILGAIEEKRLALFSCDVCRNILKQPVTVKCGHTLCLECMDQVSSKCIKCSADIDEERPKVNILVQTLIDKWKERNKVSDIDVPMVILLLHPRYILRSGCAGLQYTVDVTRNLTESGNRRSQVVKVDFPRKQLYERIPQIRRKTHRSLEKMYKRHNQENESFQKMLDKLLTELDHTLEKALRKSWNCISLEDMECLLCRKCFLDPVTTPCGHTFCRDCLTRVLDHRLTCPLCVSKLSVRDYFRGTTKILDQAVRFLFPEEFSSKIRGSFKDFVYGKSIDVPVFVCTNAFPGVACPLYVYEPRYRLLVRRCLQSPSKTFAMVSMDPSGTKFAQFGTILEVKDAVTLEDGRIILSTLGIRRFKVLSRSENDGYDTAHIEHLHDITPLPEQVSSLVALHRKVYSRAVRWVQLLSPSALSEVERLIGKMPDVENDWINLPDGPSWTWWLIPILPLSTQLQIGFLSSTSLEKRLRAIDKMLEHMKIRMRAAPKEESVSYSKPEDNVFCTD